MNIHWHKRAVAALQQVEAYVLDKFGEQTRQEFMDEVDQAVLALAKTPSIMVKSELIPFDTLSCSFALFQA